MLDFAPVHLLDCMCIMFDFFVTGSFSAACELDCDANHEKFSWKVFSCLKLVSFSLLSDIEGLLGISPGPTIRFQLNLDPGKTHKHAVNIPEMKKVSFTVLKPVIPYATISLNNRSLTHTKTFPLREIDFFLCLFLI